MISHLDGHRRVVAEERKILPFERPFSSFEFIEKKFGDCNSIRRIFSLARSLSAKALVIESLPPTGIITEENEDILSTYPQYRNLNLLRLSFWKKAMKGGGLPATTNDDLVGYAILKQDALEENPTPFCDWHVFEAVFAKYPHEHNCTPRPGVYRLTACDKEFEIIGLLFCQQNGLNKACAQVALRSLLSRILPEGDISYRRINRIAEEVHPGFNPARGLDVQQIRRVLTDLGVKFHDIDYTQENDTQRLVLPYQKYAYAGLESGYGALVGFRLAGRELQEEAKHIIPFYGHTFNKDTWVPNAEISYFRIGERVGYVPSERWTSSFIGHDDNFGPNFCIPRLYIENDKVDYVVELFRKGVCYSGLQAEAIALNILYSILPNLDSSENTWILRLRQWTKKQEVVFRAQSMESLEYMAHLGSLRDWENRAEKAELCELFEKEMPPFIWVVEISTPQLFPANERKLGEIVLDASKDLEAQDDAAIFDVFIFARLPGIYLLGGEISDEVPQFSFVPSDIQSHTELIKFQKRTKSNS